MWRPRCHVEIYRGVRHTWQILAGFLLLDQAREIDLTVTVRTPRPGDKTFVVHATVDGQRLAYDMQDDHFTVGSAANAALIESVDTFFARSYLAGSYADFEERVRPLGLNFPTVARHRHAFAAGYTTPRDTLRRAVKRAVGLDPSLRAATFEAAPRAPSGGPVLFLSRLWSRENLSAGDASDVDAINAARIACVRALRAAFGDRFLGGLAAPPSLEALAPDCLVEPAVTRKRAFLAHIRAADVCVTTRGLGGSNGWKLAEFVAASKPIVTEPLCYGVPGPFAAGRNYLEFETADQCVAQCARTSRVRSARCGRPRRTATTTSTGCAPTPSFARPWPPPSRRAPRARVAQGSYIHP